MTILWCVIHTINLYIRFWTLERPFAFPEVFALICNSSGFVRICGLLVWECIGSTSFLTTFNIEKSNRCLSLFSVDLCITFPVFNSSRYSVHHQNDTLYDRYFFVVSLLTGINLLSMCNKSRENKLKRLKHSCFAYFLV